MKNKAFKKLSNDGKSENVTSTGNFFIINKIKYDHNNKTDENLLNDKEYDYDHINNSNYHYIAVTKLNALLVKVSSHHDKDRFCLNWFYKFQTDRNLKISKYHNDIELKIHEKFITMSNKKITELEEKPGNIPKRLV